MDLEFDDDLNLKIVPPDQTLHLRDYTSERWGDRISVGCEDIEKEERVKENIVVHFNEEDSNNVVRPKKHSNNDYTEWEFNEGLEYLTNDSGAEVDTSNDHVNIFNNGDGSSSDPGGRGAFNQNADHVNLNWRHLMKSVLSIRWRASQYA